MVFVDCYVGVSVVCFDYLKGRIFVGVEIILKIAGIGILIAVVAQVLKQAGKEEIATMVTLAGLVIVLVMVVDMISQLFNTVGNLFSLF